MRAGYAASGRPDESPPELRSNHVSERVVREVVEDLIHAPCRLRAAGGTDDARRNTCDGGIGGDWTENHRAGGDPILPKTFAPSPIIAPRLTFGCRSPASLPVPPSVTFCRIETSSSTTAVAPTTSPVA